HVPFLPRDGRRAAPDPRPRQYLAAGVVGPARAGGAGFRGHARDDGALHLVQGLQARMPDRRRYGAHEDRISAPLPPPPRARRPLCCGRSFLSAGLVDEARHEARRTVDALAPYVEAGMPIVGLEPSCLLTLRDEFPAMLPSSQTKALAERAQLFEEFVESERAA